MFKNSWPLAMLAVTLAAPATNTRAHEIVGNRFFPATLAIDDPGVTDELALPTISMSKTGDDPSFKQLNVSAEYAKSYHRGLRNLRCANLVAALCAWWPEHEWRTWFAEPRDALQVPAVQECRT